MCMYIDIRIEMCVYIYIYVFVYIHIEREIYKHLSSQAKAMSGKGAAVQATRETYKHLKHNLGVEHTSRKPRKHTNT